MRRPLLGIALLAKLLGLTLWLFHEYTAAVIVFVGPDPFPLYAIFVRSAQGRDAIWPASCRSPRNCDHSSQASAS
jgi:hypothetical protein